MIVELKNRYELKQFLNKHYAVIVKVSATWCGPCNRIQPLVSNLYSKIDKHVCMVMVDADEGSDIANYLKVKTIPHLVNYIDGMPYDILTSSKEEDVKEFFNKTLQRVSENSESVVNKLLKHSEELEKSNFN